MRTKIFFLVFMLSGSLTAFGQNDSDVVITDYIQDMPKFPGGYDSLWCVLENNFRYDILNSDYKSITFLIRFIVDSSGVSRNFRCMATRPGNIILNHKDSLKMQEIFRVLELLPKWEPAKQMNKGISTWLMIPIKIPYLDFKCKR